MIRIIRLANLSGARKFGSCISCGKSSKEDSGMSKIEFSDVDSAVASICLCSDCQKSLVRKILPTGTSEIREKILDEIDKNLTAEHNWKVEEKFGFGIDTGLRIALRIVNEKS